MSPKGTNNTTCWLFFFFLSVSNATCHTIRCTEEDSEGKITGFKHTHKHTDKDIMHTHFSSSSLLIQNASSPEPKTQFSTLLWAFAVNCAARQENRHHLSWATGWRHVISTAVVLTKRSEVFWGKSSFSLLNDFEIRWRGHISTIFFSAVTIV